MVLFYLLFISLCFSYSEPITKYHISTNSTFLIEYKSIFENNFLEIVLTLEPFLNEYMFGYIYMSTKKDFNNLETIPFLNVSSEQTISFSLKFYKSQSIIYFYFKGKFYCTLTIFNPNKNITLNIDEYYFFDYVKLQERDYLSFKLERLKSNKILNLIAYNNSCSSIKIYKNNKIIECLNKINNYINLELDNEYYFEFYMETGYYLVINFFDNIISDFSEQTKEILSLNKCEFYFIVNIENYYLNKPFSFFVDSQSRSNIKGGFLKNDIKRNKIYDESIYYDKFNFQDSKYFILNKTNNEYKYILFSIKIHSDQAEKFIIKKIDSFYEINNIKYEHHLENNKRYLFTINKDFHFKFIEINPQVFLSYKIEKKMRVIVDKLIEFFNDKLLFLNLNNIEGIFFDKGEKDIFKFGFLNQSFSGLLEKNKNKILFTNTQKIFSYLNHYNDYYFFFNLITGNIKSDIFDDYNFIKPKNNTFLFKHLINETNFFYISPYSPCMFELFYFDKNYFDYFIDESQMIFLIKNFNYSLMLFDNKRMLIKLLFGTSANIYYNNQLYIVNEDNPEIEIIINQDDFAICNGDNAIIDIFLYITNNTEYQIQKNCYQCEFKDVKEFFLIPYINNNLNTMKINIIIENYNNDFDDIDANYLIDYNIIPYSRYKYDLIKKIKIIKNKANVILLDNLLKEDKVYHNEKESLYLYFNLNKIVKKVNINIEYLDLIYPNNLKPILIEGAKNTLIYFGKSIIKNIYLDQCGNPNNSIKYIIKQDDNNEIEEKFFESNEKFINISSNSNINKYLEIDNREELLLFLSNEEFEFLDDFILNNDIYLDYDEEKIIINFDSISISLQIEYVILIVEDENMKDLSNHCIIESIINNKNYLYIDIIYSIEDEGSLSTEIKYNDILELNKEYILVIVAKEFDDNYILYKYYNPKNFTIHFDYDDSFEENQPASKKKSSSKVIVVIVIVVAMVVVIGIIITVLIFKYKKKKVKGEKSDIDNAKMI